MSEPSDFMNKVHNMATKEAVAERDSYGDKVRSLTVIGVDITRNSLYQRVRRAIAKQLQQHDNPPVGEVTTDTSNSQVSSLLSSLGSSSLPTAAELSNAPKPKAGRPTGRTNKKGGMIH